MLFSELMGQLSEGKRLRRREWPIADYCYLKNGEFFSNTECKYTAINEVNSNDWEISKILKLSDLNFGDKFSLCDTVCADVFVLLNGGVLNDTFRDKNRYFYYADCSKIVYFTHENLNVIKAK